MPILGFQVKYFTCEQLDFQNVCIAEGEVIDDKVSSWRSEEKVQQKRWVMKL